MTSLTNPVKALKWPTQVKLSPPARCRLVYQEQNRTYHIHPRLELTSCFTILVSRKTQLICTNSLAKETSLARTNQTAPKSFSKTGLPRSGNTICQTKFRLLSITKISNPTSSTARSGFEQFQHAGPIFHINFYSNSYCDRVLIP